ncbi:hypothetical protein X739_13505 [Mesorhizobium sp. LNHC220B00]|nr:hypothetical protein X739_13505 [Mesorhizobium sp. LNHC220B00]
MAPPLIVLPGISPRIETGRKRLLLMVSPIASVAEKAAKFEIAPFCPSLYGEKVPAGG